MNIKMLFNKDLGVCYYCTLITKEKLNSLIGASRLLIKYVFVLIQKSLCIIDDARGLLKIVKIITGSFASFSAPSLLEAVLATEARCGR